MPMIQPRKGSLVPCKVCILASGEWRVCAQSPWLLLTTCTLSHLWVPSVVAACVTSGRIWLQLVLVFSAGHWQHSFPASQFWPRDVREPAGFFWELLCFIIKTDRGFPPSLLAWMSIDLWWSRSHSVLKKQRAREPERQQPRPLSLNPVVSRWLCKSPPS